MREINAATVKRRAKELGADLVGIASAATLNAFPPDPRWPQTPDRISPYCKSVIVLVQRIPAGAFRCKTNVPVQYIDMLVLRKMDKSPTRWPKAETAGHPSVTAAQRPTGTTARELRAAVPHLGVEAGLGTTRARVNVPRPNTTARLSHRPLTGSHWSRTSITGRCASRNPAALPAFLPGRCGAAFRHRQARLRREAQEFGFSTILQFFSTSSTCRAKRRPQYRFARRVRFLARAAARGSRLVRRLPALPRGLPDRHGYRISPTCRGDPERTPKSRARQGWKKTARAPGDRRMSEYNSRWVGREYKGMVARQLQQFKRPRPRQAELTEEGR